jgi:uncharacterized membrane protein YeaQ/YmgE (transglycosylase-associated protein family)
LSNSSLRTKRLAIHAIGVSYRILFLPEQIQGCIFDIVAKGEFEMENTGIGWIAAIIIGGLAGWFAEMFMKSNTGLIMNIILGIVGAILANALLSFFGVILTGWLGYLLAGFIGACILIAVGRMLRGTKAV